MSGIKSLHKFFSGEEKEVWVQNISSPQGNVVITVDSKSNESITVPKGIDPIPLTERFTFDQLKKSRELRQLVDDKRYLRLLTQEEAEKYYDKKGRGRYDKVNKRQNNLENRVIEAKNETEKNKEIVSDVLVDTIKVEESPIPPNLVSLDNQFANKVIDEDTYLEELEQIESDLLHEEIISFIMAKTRGSKKIKEFANNLQKQLVNDDETSESEK